MGKQLDGRTAWITGSSRGIGRVIADHLASMGASVAVHGTGPYSTRAFGEAESLAAVAEQIAERHGGRVINVHGDLTDEAIVAKLVDEIRGELGQIDILVNCAGGDIGASGTGGPDGGKPRGNDPISMSYDDLRMILDRNLMTCILCCRAVAPEMMGTKSGWIVNIGSIAGLQGSEGGAIYATAKAAVHEYSRCLAIMLRPHNVHVNVVAPGETLSPRFMASRPIDETRMSTDGTLDRYGWPIEIARAVGFFVSSDASYITGQVLRVDGGKQSWPS